MFDSEERLVKITQVIEQNRYTGICSYEIAEQVAEIDEEYMAADAVTQEVRTDGFHSDI